ncbi:hypothetical protein QTN25_001051 [Entamoeba marina]
MSHLAPIIQVNDASYPKPQLLYDCPYIQSHLCQQVKVYFPTPESSNFSGEDKDEETAYILEEDRTIADLVRDIEKDLRIKTCRTIIRKYLNEIKGPNDKVVDVTKKSH